MKWKKVLLVAAIVFLLVAVCLGGVARHKARAFGWVLVSQQVKDVSYEYHEGWHNTVSWPPWRKGNKVVKVEACFRPYETNTCLTFCEIAKAHDTTGQFIGVANYSIVRCAYAQDTWNPPYGPRHYVYIRNEQPGSLLVGRVYSAVYIWDSSW